MSERKKSPWLTVAIAACVLLALTGAYVGVYYATVTPMTIEQGAPPGTPAIYIVLDTYPASIDFGFTRSFFAPIHRLDCRIRPDTWKP
jgi:hypothetical protein